MHALPEHVTVYKRTRVFDRATTPAGFLADHSTKAGVWGRLTVLAGRLTYTILEPVEEAHQLQTGDVGVIAPGQRHKVALEEGARFYVEFLKSEAPSLGEG